MSSSNNADPLDPPSPDVDADAAESSANDVNTDAHMHDDIDAKKFGILAKVVPDLMHLLSSKSTSTTTEPTTSSSAIGNFAAAGGHSKGLDLEQLRRDKQVMSTTTASSSFDSDMSMQDMSTDDNDVTCRNDRTRKIHSLSMYVGTKPDLSQPTTTKPSSGFKPQNTTGAGNVSRMTYVWSLGFTTASSSTTKKQKRVYVGSSDMPSIITRSRIDATSTDTHLDGTDKNQVKSSVMVGMVHQMLCRLRDMREKEKQMEAVKETQKPNRDEDESDVDDGDQVVADDSGSDIFSVSSAQNDDSKVKPSGDGATTSNQASVPASSYFVTNRDKDDDKEDTHEQPDSADAAETETDKSINIHNIIHRANDMMTRLNHRDQPTQPNPDDATKNDDALAIHDLEVLGTDYDEKLSEQQQQPSTSSTQHHGRLTGLSASYANIGDGHHDIDLGHLAPSSIDYVYDYDDSDDDGDRAQRGGKRKPGNPTTSSRGNTESDATKRRKKDGGDTDFNKLSKIYQSKYGKSIE